MLFRSAQFREIVSDANTKRAIQMETLEPGKPKKNQTELEVAADKYRKMLDQVGPDGKRDYDAAEAFAQATPGLREYLDKATLGGYERLGQRSRSCRNCSLRGSNLRLIGTSRRTC